MWETVLALGCATAVACAVWYAVVAWRARHELTVGRPIAIAALGLAVTALPVLRDALHRAGPAPSVLSATGAALLLAGFGSIAVCMADRRLHFVGLPSTTAGRDQQNLRQEIIAARR